MPGVQAPIDGDVLATGVFNVKRSLFGVNTRPSVAVQASTPQNMTTWREHSHIHAGLANSAAIDRRCNLQDDALFKRQSDQGSSTVHKVLTSKPFVEARCARI